MGAARHQFALVRKWFLFEIFNKLILKKNKIKCENIYAWCSYYEFRLAIKSDRLKTGNVIDKIQ